MAVYNSPGVEPWRTMSANEVNTRDDSAPERDGTTPPLIRSSRWAAAGPRLVLPPIERSGVDSLGRSGAVIECSVTAAATDGNLSRLGLLAHRNTQSQHTLVVGRVDPVGVEIVAENQLAAEDP